MLLNDVELEDLVQSGVYVFGSLDQNVKTKEELYDILVDGKRSMCSHTAEANVEHRVGLSEHQDDFDS